MNFLEKLRIYLIFSLIFLGISVTSASSAPKIKLPLHLIKLPPGFKIELYAGDIPNARSMAVTPNGTLFVGTRSLDRVYALMDTNKDMRIDKGTVIASGLYMPNGVDFKDGSLYVAEVNRILRYDKIEANLMNPPEPVVIYDKFPKDRWHGWKFIKIGPDNKLYVPVGAPCNVCEKDYNEYENIMRMDLDGSNLEVFAKGVRNSVGFDWHPVTKELWFTDNGRDNLGDNIPPDELNHAPQKGMHFGFPYCHGTEIPDPEYGEKFPCSDFTPATQPLGPHVAGLGVQFYKGNMFPKEYHNQIFIAEHGSWNRSMKIGYRISLVRLDENQKPVAYETFAEGWLTGVDDVWGRPVDLEILPDGSMLVSDDHAGAIYRITYQND